MSYCCLNRTYTLNWQENNKNRWIFVWILPSSLIIWLSWVLGKFSKSPFSTNGKKGNTAPWTLLLFNCWWIELMLDRSGKGVARSTIKILSDVLSFHSQLLVRTDYFFLLSALVSSAVIWRWTLPHRIIEQFKWDECAFQSPRDQNLTNY